MYPQNIERSQKYRSTNVAVDASESGATSTVALRFGSDKLYICLSNKCFKLHPVYLLCDRRKTLTGSPDPTRANGTNQPSIVSSVFVVE